MTRIDVDHLSVDLDGRRVLEDVGFSLRPGQLTAVIGPNGSGKSTLLRCLAGLQRHAGSIRFDSHAHRPERIGYMPQDSGVPAPLSAWEVVLLGRVRQLGWRVRPDDVQRVTTWMERLGIAHLAHRDMEALSGGQRQLVYLAQAMVGESGVLLLDEPTSALDLCHQLEALAAVQALTHEHQLCTLLVTHDLHLVSRYADAVVLLDGGRVTAAGTWAEVWPDPAMEAAFRVHLAPLRDVHGHVHLVPHARTPTADVRLPALT